MGWEELVSNHDDGQARELSAALDAARRAGLDVLIREDLGSRRLLPAPVRDALALLQDATSALRASVVEGAVPAAGIVSQTRRQWAALSPDDSRGDLECMVDAAQVAAFESRERWGEWMLAIGVEIGLNSADRRDGVDTVELVNLIGVASDHIDQTAALSDLLDGGEPRDA